MRSLPRAAKAVIVSAGLVGALLGTTAPAQAEPVTAVDEVVRQNGISAGTDPGPLPVKGAAPGLCFSGHVQDVGWQPWVCDDSDWAFAGSTGLGLRLEAVRFVAVNTGGVTCMQAHVQNLGWLPSKCVHDAREEQIGTIGQSLRMEAVQFGNTARGMCAEAHVEQHGWLGYRCAAAGQTNVVGTASLGLRMEALTGTVL